MNDLKIEQKKLELTQSICWWVYVSCGLAGAIGFSVLTMLRITDQLPPDEYTYTRIVLHSLAIGVAMPLCLSTAFRVVAMPGMRVWFERLGALILFVVLPAFVLVGIVQWLANH